THRSRHVRLCCMSCRRGRMSTRQLQAWLLCASTFRSLTRRRSLSSCRKRSASGGGGGRPLRCVPFVRVRLVVAPCLEISDGYSKGSELFVCHVAALDQPGW